MKNKALMQAAATCLVFFLVLSSYLGTESFAVGQETVFATQTNGSASAIAALEETVADNGGWNSSLQTIYDGIALGQATVSQLQTAVDAISITSTSSAETVFYWYFVLSKFGVGLNATTIESALNQITMLPSIGGLPDDYSNSGTPSFLLYNRYDLYAYQWASQLGYETSKWDLSLAYTVFDNSVRAYGKPVLCVGSNQVGWGISYGPRYYDECAETIDMYLTFWLLGIPDGLTQAEYWWNWENANLWKDSNGGFYEYALSWQTVECEAGPFDQIIWKLYYNDPSTANITNLFTDMETRALSQGWNSSQWSSYVVMHATENPQLRLENTIASWAAILGLYGNMTSDMQNQVQALLDGSAGPAPAWNLTMQRGLYDNSTGMFRIHSDASDSVEATADGAVLLMLLSIVPINGSLAVPIQDCTYQDINNIIDGQTSSINFANRTVTVSVSNPGTFLSMFGTSILEYSLNATGVWQLTFANDWNSLTSQTLLSPLPTSRVYLGAMNGTTITASSDQGSTITPAGVTRISLGGNQTVDFSAIDGYEITEVLVNGQPIAITGNYTFTDVEEPQAISVHSLSLATPTPPPIPIPNFPSSIPTLNLPTTATPTPTQKLTPTPTATTTPPPTGLQTTTPSPTPAHVAPEFSAALAIIILLLIFSAAAALTLARKTTKRAIQT